MTDERIVAVRRSIRRFANTTQELDALQVGVIIWSRVEGQGDRWAAFCKMQCGDGAGVRVSEWRSFRVRGDASVELGDIVVPVPVSLVLALHDRSRIEGWDPERLSEDKLNEDMKAVQDSLTWVANTKEEMDALPVGTIVRIGTENDPRDPGTLVKLPFAVRGLTYYKSTLRVDPSTVPVAERLDDPMWWLFTVSPGGNVDVILPYRVVPPCVVLNWGDEK